MDDIFDQQQDPDKYDSAASLQREKESQYNMGYYAGIEHTYEQKESSKSYIDGYTKGLESSKEDFHLAGIRE